jgi:hypothetical protein
VSVVPVLGHWRKRQSPSRAAGSILKGAGHRFLVQGRLEVRWQGPSGIACPIWAAPQGLTFGASLHPSRCLFPQRSTGATLERHSLPTPARLSIWQGDYCADSRMRVYDGGIGGSARRFVDRFATILWRLVAGSGALGTGSPGVALLGWRRGPMDRAAGNCTGPGSKNFKVFRAFDPPL